jgi:hypothetical protein
MPPATDASNSRSTPAVAATPNSSRRSSRAALAGGDDRRRLERSEDQRARGLDATDHLNDHVDARVRHDRFAVVGEDPRPERDRAFLREVLDRDASHLYPHARAAGDQVGVRVEQADERGPDVAAPEDAHPHEAVTVASHSHHSYSARCGVLFG